MKRNYNKLERKRIKKIKNEQRYNRGINCHYPCGVEFISKYEEPNIFNIKTNENFFSYFDRPNGIEYSTIRRYYFNAGFKKYFKKISNRKIRRKKNFSQYKGNNYKKIFNIWNEIY